MGFALPTYSPIRTGVNFLRQEKSEKIKTKKKNSEEKYLCRFAICFNQNKMERKPRLHCKGHPFLAKVGGEDQM